MRSVMVASLMLMSVAAAQWTEVDEKGKLAEGQWQAVTLSTPNGTLAGWRTQTRSDNPHFLVRWFEPTRQVVEVTFVVKAPPQGRRGLSFGLGFGAPTHWANEALRLALGGNGFVLHRDVPDGFTWRSRFGWFGVAPFRFDEWLTVRLVADPTIGAFRLWLNGRPTELLPFLSPVPQVSCVFLFNGEGDGAIVEVSEPQIRIGSLPNAPKSLRVTPVGHDRLQLRWQPSETPTFALTASIGGGKRLPKFPPM
jgi:hypothetical protein